MGGFDAVTTAGADADRGGGSRRFEAPSDDHDFVALHIEELDTGIESLADIELEGAVSRFQVVALVFGFFDAIDEGAARVVVETVGQGVVLAQEVIDVAAAGKIADQNALVVADKFGSDVFVGFGILEHGADMDAAFVGEGALTDVGLSARDLQVGEFRDVAGCGGEALEFVGADGFVAQFQFQVRNDAGEIGIATAFAVAVEAALYVRGTLFHGSQGIGYRDIGIVVDMDAEDAFEGGANVGNDLGEELGESAAVGVAETEDIGTSVFGGGERLHGVLTVVNVAIEKVLGVVYDFFAVLLEVGHRLRDQQEIFFEADAERAVHVHVPRFSEDGHDRGTGFDQLTDIAIFMDRIFRETRGPESGELCVFQFEATRPREEFLVFGIGTGPSAFNVVNTELIEFLRNKDFVLNGERDGFALRAVAKSGIESLNAHGVCLKFSPLGGYHSFFGDSLFLLLFQEGHHGAEFAADGFDELFVLRIAHVEELVAAFFVFGDPLAGELAGLNFGKDALHFGAGLIGDDAGSAGVVAVLGGV